MILVTIYDLGILGVRHYSAVQMVGFITQTRTRYNTTTAKQTGGIPILPNVY